MRCNSSAIDRIIGESSLRMWLGLNCYYEICRIERSAYKMQGKMIYCNKCGRPICIEEYIEKADYLKIEKNWGYFSNKDGTCAKINICEDCYDEIVQGFQIPPVIEENTEFL